MLFLDRDTHDQNFTSNGDTLVKPIQKFYSASFDLKFCIFLIIIKRVQNYDFRASGDGEESESFLITIVSIVCSLFAKCYLPFRA